MRDREQPNNGIVPERRRSAVQVGDLGARLVGLANENDPGARSKSITQLAEEISRAGKSGLDQLLAELSSPESDVITAALAVITHPAMFNLYARSAQGLGVVITEVSALFTSADSEVALVAAATVQFLLKDSRIDSESVRILRQDIKAGRELSLAMALVLSYAEDEMPRER